MPDDRPDFIPHTQSATDARPDFIPHTEAKTGVQQAMADAPAQSKSLYERITAQPGQDESGIERFAHAALGNIVGAPEAIYHMVADAPSPEEKKADPMATQYDPFLMGTRLARPVIEGVKGWAAPDRPSWSGIKSVLPEALGTGVGQVAVGKAMKIAPEKVIGAFKSAAALIEKQPTIEQGKIAYVNTARNAAHQLENAVNTRGVGARVKAVTDADALDNQRTGSPGGVHTASAQTAGIKAEAETKIPGNLYNYPAQMTLDQAKAQLTLMGRDAARMERAGKAPEAKAVWAQYDALRDATQERAEELSKKTGQPFGKNWSDYSTEFKNFLKLHEGVLGHLMEGEHTAALDKLIQHSGQLPELKDWFDKYGVDMKPIQDAATEGGKLVDLTKANSNAVMGKIKLLSRHWALGLPALAGAHYGAAAAGLGGGIGGFILPLIVAGKVAGVLDKMQVRELLYDLKNKVQPEQFRVAPGPVGPLEQLHRAASAGVPELSQTETPGGEPLDEAMKRGAPGAPPTEPAPASAKEASDVEAAKRKEATSKAALAKGVSEARKQRSVYKGKR